MPPKENEQKSPPELTPELPPEPERPLSTEFQWLMQAINRLEDKMEDKINKMGKDLDQARRSVHIGLGILIGLQIAGWILGAISRFTPN